MIREAREKDIEEIINVLRGYGFRLLSAQDSSKVDPDFKEDIYLRNDITEIDLKNAFVAVHEGRIVGFCHYKQLDSSSAKTTLITVLPEFRGRGFGKDLQIARMKHAYKKGCKMLMTWCEGPEAIEWYVKNFKYKISGTEPLLHRLYFLRQGNKVIWGIHYGFKKKEQKKMICDLDEFFKNKENNKNEKNNN